VRRCWAEPTPRKLISHGSIMGNWLGYWSLKRDPFDGRRSAFVATAGHGEAVARLVHTIETAGRSARLIARAGLGKSRVLARALGATRSPDRRIVRINAPTDGTDLFARLAVELGMRVTPGSTRAVAWRALAEAARLARWQGLQVVLAIDGIDGLATASDRMDLERLDELDPDPSTRLTVLRLGRPDGPVLSEWDQTGIANDWSLTVRLNPLTHSETAGYLAAKLEAAGRAEPSFTARAITRLHSVSAGVPRGIDRIAGLALMASAFRGLEMVPPEVVEEAACECSAIETSISDS
jgi:type II secretory pathway predicted ATPase ExeA